MVCPRSWESAGGRLREATATAGKKGNTGSFVMRFGVGEAPDLSGKKHLLIVWPCCRCWCHRKCESAPVLVAFSATFPAMCEFPAVVLSDGDESEDPVADNTSNAVLETVINFHSGELLGECLLDTELGRLALTCHFALDCLGDLRGTTVKGDGHSSESHAREGCVCYGVVSTGLALGRY